MPFQTTVVNEKLPFGVVGEIALLGPCRAHPYVLDSADALENVVGRAFTVKSEGVAQVGGDAGVFAGILVNPKEYAYAGVMGEINGLLAAPNGTTVTLLDMGFIWAKLNGSAAIGSLVAYDDDTGELIAGAAGAGQTQVPNCKVVQYTVGANGYALLQLTN
jgi:hypothetical protein